MKIAISRNGKLVAWVEDEVVYIVKSYYNVLREYYKKHGCKVFRRV